MDSEIGSDSNKFLHNQAHICVRPPAKKCRKDKAQASSEQDGWLDPALGAEIEADLARAMGVHSDADDGECAPSDDGDVAEAVASDDGDEDKPEQPPGESDEAIDLLDEDFAVPQIPLPRLEPLDQNLLFEMKDIATSRCKDASDALRLAQQTARSLFPVGDAALRPPQREKLSLVVHEDNVSVVLWTDPETFFGRDIALSTDGKMKGFVPFKCKPRSFEGCRFVVHDIGVSHYQKRGFFVQVPQWVLLLKSHAAAQIYPGPLHFHSQRFCLFCDCITGRDGSARLIVDAHDCIYQCMECTCVWHLGCAMLATTYWRSSEVAASGHVGSSFRCSVCLPV